MRTVLRLSCLACLAHCRVLPAQFRSDARLVVIHATVTDRHGNFVKDLPQNAFRVFEDGRPQTLREAVREDIPVTVGVLMDESGSTSQYRPVMADALTGVAGALKPADEIFIAHFGMFFTVDLPPASPPADLRPQLPDIVRRYLRPQYQVGTRLYDSVQQAAGFLQKTARRDKRVLLLITDGKDTTSLVAEKQFLANCRRSETLLYAIGFDARHGERTLDQMTAAGGGHAFYPARPADLPAIALQFVQEIRSQYTLTYAPDSAGSGEAWHALRVAVAHPSGLIVRCRPGYYSHPPD